MKLLHRNWQICTRIDAIKTKTQTKKNGLRKKGKAKGKITKKKLNSPEWLHHRGITRVTRGLNNAANELEPQFLFGNTC